MKISPDYSEIVSTANESIECIADLRKIIKELCDSYDHPLPDYSISRAVEVTQKLVSITTL